MKRILILSMSCNLNFFKVQEEVVKMTWAKSIIDGEFPNIGMYFYTSTQNDTGDDFTDEESHKMFVHSGDSRLDTWEKTKRAFKLILREDFPFKDFDYVFRTNTSTYINVKMLNDFVQQIEDPDIVYAGTLLSAELTTGPYKWCIYPQGNSMLLPRKYIEVITNEECISNVRKMDNIIGQVAYSDLYTKVHEMSYMIDDTMIGMILNTHFIQQGQNHFLFYRSFGCPRIIEMKDGVFNKDIAISIKYSFGRDDLTRRTKEFKILTALHKEIKDSPYTLEEVLKNVEESTIFWHADTIQGIEEKFSAKKMIKLLVCFSDIPFINLKSKK